MTPRQRKIARHALGLPTTRMMSYRNHYVANYDPDNGYLVDWLKMEEAGQAVVSVPRNGMCRCWLTRAGANTALESGERSLIT